MKDDLDDAFPFLVIVREERRAMSLYVQSGRLADLGRREEALATIEQAVAIRRQLAEARPDEFLPDLAMALKDQSGLLADLGRREEALAAIEQAAGIYRQLAEARPDAFFPALATALNNQWNCRAGPPTPCERCGARERAITPRWETVGVWCSLPAPVRPWRRTTCGATSARSWTTQDWRARSGRPASCGTASCPCCRTMASA